jgi:serine/threonine-protein kinase
MALVYKARDLALERTVAIKILRPEYSGSENFVQEARAIARVPHPNIVTVHDVRQDGDIQYIVMEYVRGQDLKEWIRADAPFRVGQALDIIVQICAAVGFAHDEGLLHCDLKPQNVLVLPDGQVKVTDFGIARALSSDSTQSNSRGWGTPHYASPELIAGRPLTPASDQYAIGIIFYELLTGKPPFDGQTVVEIARQHALSAPPPVYHENPRVPRYLEQILDRTLAKDPARRYPSVKQLGKLLTAYRQRGEAITQPLPALPRTMSEPARQPTGSLDTPATGTLSRPTAAPAAATAVLDARPQRRRRIDWLMLILAALAFVAVVGLVPLWTTVFGMAMEPEAPPTAALSTPTATTVAAQPTQDAASAATATPVPFVQVPNLLGLELETAKLRASEMGLELRVNKDRYDSEIPAMHIYSQTPPPDAQALAGSEVVVVVSLGPEPVVMPSVTGFPAGVKRLELEELGLVVALAEAKSRETAGLILDQEPPPGTEIQPGSTVTLTVSDGTYAEVRANLDDKVLLLACELNSTTFRPGDTAQITLTWQVLNPIPEAYTTFIHITDAGGKIVTQLDRPPLQGRPPTNTWTVGSELTDPYNVILPRSIEPGMYEIQVGLYIGDDRLPVLDPGRARVHENAVIVHQITITGD